MSKVEKLLQTVKAKGLMRLTEAASLVAGEQIIGSWWSHPKGKEIFRVLSAFEDENDIRSCKLIDGKVTFVHRRLWPALLRVASDRSRFKPTSSAALAGLKKLPGPLENKVRTELEKKLLVIGRSEHTPGGRHEVRLVPFADAFPKESRAVAKKLSIADAVAALEGCGWSPP